MSSNLNMKAAQRPRLVGVSRLNQAGQSFSQFEALTLQALASAYLKGQYRPSGPVGLLTRKSV